MKVKIKKLHPDAIVPTYGTDGAAAFDLYATYIKKDSSTVSGAAFMVAGTGLAFDIPHGHAMIIKPRSGLAFKYDLEAFGGVIDSDYRGEVKIKLTNSTGTSVPNHLFAGDRIAQAIIIPIPKVEFEVVEELSDTDRGNNGFGSTGA